MLNNLEELEVSTSENINFDIPFSPICSLTSPKFQFKYINEDISVICGDHQYPILSANSHEIYAKLLLYMKAFLYAENTKGKLQPTAHCLHKEITTEENNITELIETPVQMIRAENNWQFEFKNYHILRMDKSSNKRKESTRNILRTKYHKLREYEVHSLDDNEIERLIEDYMERSDSLKLYIKYIIYVVKEDNILLKCHEGFSQPIVLLYSTPTCSIYRQPVSGLRFRYRSEVKTSTHGEILAENSTATENQYPMVSIEPTTPIEDKLYMKAFLYVENNKRYEPAVHSLHRDILKNEEDIFELIQDPSPMILKNNKWIYEFKKFYIIRIERKSDAGKRDSRNILKAKYQKLSKFGVLNIDDNQMQQNIEEQLNRKDTLKVFINFITFRKDGEGNFFKIHQQFSNPIVHVQVKCLLIEKGCDLRVARDPSGNEQNITLVVNDKVDKKKFKLIVYYIGKNNCRLHEQTVPENNIKLYGQNHVIEFKPPKLPNELQNQSSDIEFYVTLERHSDNYSPQPIKYIYTNYFSPPPTKRKRVRECNTDMNKSYLESDGIGEEEGIIPSKPTGKLNAFLSALHQLSLNTPKEDITDILLPPKENGETVLHTIIREGMLKKIYSRLHELHIGKDCWHWRNQSGETVLHTAILCQRSDYIRPLIGFECSINEQDNRGSTPVHLAIQLSQSNTIEILRKLLQNPKQYFHLTEEFKKMFSIYNFQGYTALHLAIVKDMPDLVEGMLDFCKREDVDPCLIGTLECADTILHLAVNNNMFNMTKLILERFKKAHLYENYAQQSVFDMILDDDTEVSDEICHLIDKLTVNE